MATQGRRTGLFVFFALVFGISWGGVLAVIGLDGVLGTTEIPEQRLPLVYLATLLGPLLAGVGATAWAEGRPGLRALGRRLREWRVPGGWLATALLVAPLTMLATLLALAVWDPVFLPPFLVGESDLATWPLAIFMGLVVATCEELGWTAFLQPRLQMGLLAKGLLMGLVWGLWHLPLFSGAAAGQDLPPLLYLAVVLFSFLVPFRVLMAWVYERSGSLWAVVLMHAPLAAGQLVLVPPDLQGPHMVAYDLALAAMLWALAATALTAPRTVPAARPR